MKGTSRALFGTGSDCVIRSWDWRGRRTHRGKDGAFIVVSPAVTSHVDPRGLVPVDLEMRVQPPFDHPFACLPFQDGRRRDSRHRGDDRRIDQCQRLCDVLQPSVFDQRLELAAEFLNDLDQPVRIEHGRRF